MVIHIVFMKAVQLNLKTFHVIHNLLCKNKCTNEEVKKYVHRMVKLFIENNFLLWVEDSLNETQPIILDSM